MQYDSETLRESMTQRAGSMISDQCYHHVGAVSVYIICYKQESAQSIAINYSSTEAPIPDDVGSIMLTDEEGVFEKKL